MQLTNAMLREENGLIVTRQTFMLSTNLPNKSKYRIIADEGLDNLYTAVVLPIYTRNDHIKIFWQNHYRVVEEDAAKLEECLKMNPVPRNTFVKLEMHGFSKDGIMRRSREYRHVIDQNRTWYISPYDYQIMYEIVEATHFNMYGIAKPSVLEGYKQNHIASAAFMYTPLRYFMDHHNLEYTIDQQQQFIPHEFKLEIHNLNIKQWSKNMRTKQRESPDSYEKQFYSYVQNNAGDDPVMVLRNVDSSDTPTFFVSDKFTTEVEVSHNAHGLNDPNMQQCEHIAITAAVNPSQQFSAFLSEVFLTKVPEEDKPKVISMMFSGINFYQIAMRSILRQRSFIRSGKTAHIYVMDQITADNMDAFFKNAVHTVIPTNKKLRTYTKKEIDLTNPVEKEKLMIKISSKEQKLEKLLDATKDRAMTSAERQQKRALKNDIKKLSLKI